MAQKKKTVAKAAKDKKQKITKNMTIGEAGMAYPEAVEVLLEEGVHCIGCGAAYHETIEEGLSAHGKSKKDIDNIVKRMNQALGGVKCDPETITLTKNASSKIKEIMKEEKKPGHSLRIQVKQGGCSGYEYVLDFDKKEKKGDKIIKTAGISIIIDKESFEMMKGSKIDYVETHHGAGFKITNPNAPSSCGCGE